MMKNHGFDPVIIKPECEENLPAGISGSDAVLFLSYKKAHTVEKMLLASPDAEEYKDAYIVAADTIVYLDGIIGKPQDRQDCIRMMNHLNGRTHYVLTGVTIIRCGTAVRTSFFDETRVFFREYTDQFIQKYADTAEPYDKAGGYAIQGTMGQYIDHIEGDMNNVIGFPWDRFEEELNKLGD